MVECKSCEIWWAIPIQLKYVLGSKRNPFQSLLRWAPEEADTSQNDHNPCDYWQVVLQLALFNARFLTSWLIAIILLINMIKKGKITFHISSTNNQRSHLCGTVVIQPPKFCKHYSFLKNLVKWQYVESAVRPRILL